MDTYENEKRAAHKDVELATELVCDVADQALPLVSDRDIADRSGDTASPCLPILEALVKLRLVKGARVHSRSQRHQLPPPACTRHMTPVEITIAGTSLWLRDEGV